jgi:nicotinamidase/pyrazinamidase
MTRGLLIVDVQIDFCEGGALAVSGGNAVAQGVARLLTERPGLYTTVFASQDWHNPLPDTNGGHFAAPGEAPDYVNTWPVHCVAGTRGAKLHPDLAPALAMSGAMSIQKGQGRPDYSAFQGHNPYGRQSLSWELGEWQVTSLDIVGIATDHCVRASALDALNLGYRLREVRLITDLMAGVDEAASQDALDSLTEAGAQVITTSYL